MSFDRNEASLALCHARAILMLLSGSNTDLADVISAATYFVEQAKDMIDGVKKPQEGLS